MIDTHIHADSRSSEDFEQMFISGIETAVTCSYYPYKLNNEEVLLNHLERILYYDTKRASKYGLDLKVALGIHPTNLIKKPEIIFDKLHECLEKNQIIAIGEIGLENLSSDEIAIFKEQLKIADEAKTKVIIHTPRKNKLDVLKIIKNIVLENIDPNLAIIDHINSAVIEEIIDEKFTIGITVQPEKMDKEEAIAIFEKYGYDKFILNSDISNMPSDPLSVPKTIAEMKKLGISLNRINKIAFKNAKKAFKI
ncbi:MAG: TatD family hydrolase [Methanobrevibacter sp.]|jgi:predicted metal-dependent TIM-barrel fold hydrolase|nr:TatD family hydrolase [Methanobrevibacter sp.]